MIVCRSKEALENGIEGLKEGGRSVAFVPTMGALHEGHLSLVRLAREAADRVVVSIFVNPTQFAPHEDFDAYPRQVEADAARLEAEGADLLYTPGEGDIYPEGAQATLKAGVAAQGLEGDCRPGHFDGVVTVVHRLFAQVRPDIAVFGEKDYQQLQVIREMAEAEKLPVRIIGAPIMRDEAGLALSSRNAYLSPDALEIARMLNQILYKCAADIGAGAEAGKATKDAAEMLLTCGFDKVDYVSVWHGRVLAAAWLGRTRLIDNAPL